MSHIALVAGDRVVFENPGKDGKVRKLRGVVADTMNIKSRGEELLVPVVRPRNSKRCRADDLGRKVKPPKLRWIERSKVRKLPD